MEQNQYNHNILSQSIIENIRLYRELEIMEKEIDSLKTLVRGWGKLYNTVVDENDILNSRIKTLKRKKFSRSH